MRHWQQGGLLDDQVGLTRFRAVTGFVFEHWQEDLEMPFKSLTVGLAFSGLMGLLGPAPAVAADASYIRPAVNGIAVDHCVTWGRNCGQAGADQFCRAQGYATALSFTLYKPGRTYVLGSQQVCQGGVCVGLDQVTCRGGGSGNDVTFNNPQLGGAAVDHCATWGTNCGQGGADQYCRVAGRTRATSFQLYRPGRTYVIGSQQTCVGDSCVGLSQVTCDGSAVVTPPVTTQVIPPPIVNPPVGATMCNGFDGIWDSDYGRITVRGGQGSYTYKGMAASISGAMRGNIFIGAYSQPGYSDPRYRSGNVSFTISPNGDSFAGPWTDANNVPGGQWTGKCVGK